MTALLRLAVLCVDPDGRISYWNRGAEELFGHRWEHVFGHRASGLLTATRAAAGAAPTASGTAHQDTLDVLDDLTTSAWAGALAATDRDGTVKDVLWWTYRIAEPGGRSLLAIAANARPLRTGGLRIAVGGRLLPYTAEGPQRQDIAIAAVLCPAPDPAQGHALTARLGTILPGVSPGRLDRIVRQIAPLGHPALEVEGSARLPVTPQDYAQVAAAARADRSARRELLPGPRPDPAAIPGPAAGPAAAPAACPPVPPAPESLTPGNGSATQGGDRSSASALTAVPFPTAGPAGPVGTFPPPHPAAAPPAPPGPPAPGDRHPQARDPPGGRPTAPAARCRAARWTSSCRCCARPAPWSAPPSTCTRPPASCARSRCRASPTSPPSSSWTSSSPTPSRPRTTGPRTRCWSAGSRSPTARGAGRAGTPRCPRANCSRCPRRTRCRGSATRSCCRSSTRRWPPTSPRTWASPRSAGCWPGIR
ncbi:PAS domain-containing protein [Actinacidiphila bryophytorum]|uniref:PAS domain-containing protein n=1 Tax=Actinacidiphila bryophytorum TaxID=1436133 RepID=UPI002176EE4A|nr:PAS domain-containing protein [Actinacidiphila bryophytorum]UWE07324.1 PAS domain-containing protein [Actinacidiphila bryophytorum]